MNESNRVYLINKYNFSRRMVDHRKPFDLNHAVN